MMQSIRSDEGTLRVRDAHGRYHPATAEQILEAARRVVDQRMQRGASFQAPGDVAAYLRAKLAGLEHEVFAMLCLDNRHCLIAYEEMFRGTIDGASVHPREVAKEALRHNAAAVIVAHNHPSGHPEPSTADRAITLRLREALNLFDVRLLDHFVVAGHAVVSMAERGWV